MDLARFCSKRLTTFFKDNTVAVSIKWYRAPADAKVFPSYHKWGRLDWYSYPWEADGVGENYEASLRWWNGETPPSAKGQSFVGTLQQFQEGCAFDPFNITARDLWGLAVECAEQHDYILLEDGEYLVWQEDATPIYLETSP